MKRLLIPLLALFLVAASLSPLPAVAQSAAHVTGGGTGTFNADLDGDGDTDGSQFGLGVVVRGTTVKGHFECLMAGLSDFLGLHLMAVEGKVQGGFIAGESATFNGVATVNLGDGQIFRGVPFAVTVTEGGPGAGTLQLTVIGAFDGAPGDTAPGNGNYDLPVETVTSGQIRIH
jgi:hypothetical protein